MKIVLSKLPKSGWWKNGVPKYNDNPAMKQGKIPNMSLLVKERDYLIKAISEEGHEIIELAFPKQLDDINVIVDNTSVQFFNTAKEYLSIANSKGMTGISRM